MNLSELSHCLPVIPSTMGGEFQGLKKLPDPNDLSSIPGTASFDSNKGTFNEHCYELSFLF